MSRSETFSSKANIMAESRWMLALAWPIILTNMNWTLMHIIDVLIVGWAGTGELAALGSARVLGFVAMVMGMAGLSGVLVYVSRADGAGDLPETGHVFRQGIILALILGLGFGGALFAFAYPALAATGVATELVVPGSNVLRAMAIGFPGQMLLAAATYFLEGVSRPRRVMVVNLVMLPANALLAWAWVGGHFGLPAMGAVGAAAATSVVSLSGAALMLGAAWNLPQSVARNVRDTSLKSWKAAMRDVPKLIRFGIAPAIASSLELAGFAYLITLTTQLGITVTAAFQVVFSLHNAGFALALGLSSAAGVRVGNMVGANKPNEIFPIVMIASVLSLMFMAVPVLLYLIIPGAVAGTFSSEAAVVAEAAIMLFILAPFILLDGLQAVMLAALRSLGDQVVGGINGVIGFFIVMGGSGYWFVTNGYGALGVVYALGIGMAVTTILQSARFWFVSARVTRQAHQPSQVQDA